MLEYLGCKVELVNNGQEALSKVHHNYQLIFMDLGLPDMDGYTVTTEIRRREKGATRVPIVVLTAYLLSEVTDKCLAAGVDAVFNKPINPEKLKNILESFL